MKRVTDDTRPPSKSYRETYGRHRMLFRIPLLLGAAVASLMLFTSSASYTSTASLWVDTAAPVASSIGADGSPTLAEPPASAEQGILTELLTTDSFADSVARSSALGRSLGSEAAIRMDAPMLLEHGQVEATPTGGQILNLSYTGSSRAEAVSVLGGIVTQLRDYNNSLAKQHGAAGLAYDREQVTLDQAALATANNDLKVYVAKHPGASRADPNYLSLASAQNTAVTELGQANTTLDQATGSGDSGGWTINVLDAPGPALNKALGKKKILEVVLGGALGGLLVSFLAVVALTPAKKEGWEDELPLGRPSDLDPSSGARSQGASPSSAPTGWGQRGPFDATAGRRFMVGISSEQMDKQLSESGT